MTSHIHVIGFQLAVSQHAKPVGAGVCVIVKVPLAILLLHAGVSSVDTITVYVPEESAVKLDTLPGLFAPVGTVQL